MNKQFKSSADKIKEDFKSVDYLFTNEETRQDEQREKIVEVALSDLRPFDRHPFKVLDDEKMQDTVDSIKKHGVLVPAIARPCDDGGYEIVAGHRRHHASQLAGLETMPVIIRDLDDDEATIIMVDSNLQREEILPSERAFAYKMKLEAMKRQGNRSDLTCGQVVHKLKARDIMAEEVGESGRQIQRFIRLTNLIDPLLDMVDEKKMAFSPAIEISYLKFDEQKDLLDAMGTTEASPSLAQAQRMKKYSADGKLSFGVLETILEEQKKPEQSKITFSTSEINKFFPKSYSPEKMQDTILKLLQKWHKQELAKQDVR